MLAELIIEHSRLTPFERKVLLRATRIRRGRTLTYKELAKTLGRKNAFRAVGNALSKNPLPIIVPCHRVVGTHGIGGYKLGNFTKSMLLSLERAFPAP